MSKHKIAYFTRRLRSPCALVVAALAGLALAGCGGGQRAATVGWPVWGGDAQNTHSSSLRQVGPGNVGKLSLVWKRAEGQKQSSWETFPVVVGRTMYYTTTMGQVMAVNAATGAVRWSYTPHENFLADPNAFIVEPTSRGVTVANGRVYTLTYDDQLIALNLRTGKPVWDVRVGNLVTGAAETSPGTYWHGEIIIGGPAGDAGLRGFVAAYSAADGKQLWRRYVVPARSKGWTGANKANGGGDVWMPPTVDQKTGVVFAATGDPMPAFIPGVRPGCNRWTDSTVAINARTGALLWGHSTACNDAWDYDVDQSPILFQLKAGAGRRPIVADASKAGYVYFLDARSGSLVSRSPSLVPFSEPHRKPTTDGTVVCPGDFGGIEYGPSAYSSQSGLMYTTATASCQVYETLTDGAAQHRPGGDDQGGLVIPVGKTYGVVAAVDPSTGKVAWRRRLPQAARGGVLAAGGLLFTGDDNGYLYALDARTGAIRWRFHAGLRFGSAPFTYELAGREYLAVAAGGSQAPRHGKNLAPAGGELFVFALPR